MNEKITLIVPCYNEEESLPIFYETFLKLCENMKDKVDFELLLVNDGSKDKTFEIFCDLAHKDSKVKYLSLSRNFGKEAAMLAGLENSKGDFVVIADADLQHPLEMISDMYYHIKNENYDCVAAKRLNRDGEPIIRSYFANKFYQIINKFSPTQIVSGSSDFRLMTRQMVNSVLELQEYNRFSKGLFSFVGYNTKWIEYKNVERVAGETTWSFWGLFKYSLEGIFAFTTAPLHIASILGLVVCFLSFLFIVYTLLRTAFWGDPVAGYPTLICITTFLGGIQLFCVGILSEYVSKIYSEVKKRPVYVIKSRND